MSWSAPRPLAVARQFLASYYALMLEYRAEIFLWVIANVLPFILMGIWVQAAATSGRGLSAEYFMRYFLAIFIIRQFTIVWVIWEFEMLVVEGKLSALLLRPIDPVWSFIAMHAGEQLTRIPFWASIVAGFLLLNPHVAWLPSAADLGLAIAATMLAFVLRFAMQYTFALLSFWIERASALERISFLPYLFLSGMVAPLETFPPWIREIALLTPFPYLLYFPAKLLIGVPAEVTLGRAFLTIGVWCIVLIVANRVLWRAGLRQYSGMGA